MASAITPLITKKMNEQITKAFIEKAGKRMFLKNKTILLTGGTGSFGQKFTEIVLKEHQPRVLRIFSRGEFLQDEMRKNFNDDPRLRFFIGDVRDRDRVYRAMDGVDVVVHAAALKQIGACEYNPIEAIKTNIEGATNIISAAIDNSVEKVMALSTDKAAHPVNLYGATKLVAEKLFVQANVYTHGGKIKFGCIRYGNVVGSRGSVIPLFLKQKDTGEITITDGEMTRFWITLDQGVRFVINSIDKLQGGEIFVPKIASMKVSDLADVLAPNARKKIIGIRPSEKIHEVLLTADEARHAKEFDDYFIIEPEYPFWGKLNNVDGKSMSEGFQYSSDLNNESVSSSELNEMIASYQTDNSSTK